MRVYRFLSFSVTISLGLGPGSLHAQDFPPASQILAEALREAESVGHRAYRFKVYLESAPLLERIGDTAGAESVLERAVALAPELPSGGAYLSASGGESLAKDLLAAALAGAVIGVAVRGLTGPQPNSFLSHLEHISRENMLANMLQTGFRQSLYGDRAKLQPVYATTISLEEDLFELLAARHSERALEIASQISADPAASSTVQITLQSWPANQRHSVLARVKAIAAEELRKKKPSAAVLATLAGGVAPDEPDLAREWTSAAVRALPPKDADETVYATVAALDREAAESLLTSLTLTRGEELPFRLASYARSVVSSHPDLAWRAFSSIDARSEKLSALRASVLRQIAARLPSELKTPAIEVARRLVSSAAARGDWEEGPLYPVWDGLVAFDYLQPGASFEELARAASGPSEGSILGNRGAFFFYYANEERLPKFGFSKAKREKMRDFMERSDTVRKTFLPNLIRLDLALSRIASDPGGSLSVLEGFDDLFWTALAAATLQRAAFETPESGLPGFHDLPGSEPIPSRLTRLVAEVRLKWPAAAKQMQETNRSVAVSSLLKFAGACESMDRAGRRVMHDKRGKTAWLWLDYLPFSLTFAGSALMGVAPDAASEAFRSSVELAKELTSPAREWALCWNAAVWLETTNSEDARTAMAEAVQEAAALKDHKPWEVLLPNLAYRVARFDPAAALRIARSEEARDVKARALTAVVAGMTDGRR
jgi:hypothetical protein